MADIKVIYEDVTVYRGHPDGFLQANEGDGDVEEMVCEALEIGFSERGFISGFWRIERVPERIAV